MKKSIIFLFSILIAGSLACIPFLSKSAENEKREIPSNLDEAAALPVMPPKVPKSFRFAGETIDLQRSDLRERMDRELIAFTFGHSNSVLMIKRANRIFPQVEPILKQQGLPDDLKYLMVIESNLDPKALSTASAAGLWQFTANTAKQYGLEVNSYVDERYHTEKATVAACQYLRNSYEKFGDWLTVAASYNAGTAGIASKLSAQHQSKAIDLVLVEETSRYMFRLMVAKMMFEKPSSFGFHFTAEDLYPYIPPKEIVETTEPITDLVAFAEEHGVTFAQLKSANLWLRGTSLPNASKRKYRIAIPDVKAENYKPYRTVVHNPAWLK